MANFKFQHTQEETIENIKRGNQEIRKTIKVKKHEFISKKGDTKKGIGAILIVGIILFFISIMWLVYKDKITLEQANISIDQLSIEYLFTEE